MARLNLLTATAVAAVLGIAGAQAADMPVYYEQQAQPEFGGWYIRGDVGATNQQTDGIFNSVYDTVDSFDVLEEEFDASWFVGFGVGYKFNDWFRADITGEYRGPSDFFGLDSIDDDGDPAPDVINEFRTEKSEWTFLANAYWDITTWHSITPFIGAGVGASYNRIGSLTDLNLIDPLGGPSCPVSNGCASSNGDWQFAWALHAGLGFAVTPNMTVELAYRYLNLGDAQSGDIIGSDGTNLVVNPVEFDSLTSHDVKLGLRYVFN
jgi:opacity protein-like surface antigen